jgi:hypothetical protein
VTDATATDIVAPAAIATQSASIMATCFNIVPPTLHQSSMRLQSLTLSSGNGDLERTRRNDGDSAEAFSSVLRHRSDPEKGGISAGSDGARYSGPKRHDRTVVWFES